jgi:hypothetical protein
MAIQKYFFAAVLFFLPAYFSAQTTGFIQYSVEKGMVQSQVQTLIQDDQGNLWIGTLGGLSRYNGIGRLGNNIIQRQTGKPLVWSLGRRRVYF